MRLLLTAAFQIYDRFIPYSREHRFRQELLAGFRHRCMGFGDYVGPRRNHVHPRAVRANQTSQLVSVRDGRHRMHLTPSANGFVRLDVLEVLVHEILPQLRSLTSAVDAREEGVSALTENYGRHDRANRSAWRPRGSLPGISRYPVSASSARDTLRRAD